MHSETFYEDDRLPLCSDILMFFVVLCSGYLSKLHSRTYSKADGRIKHVAWPGALRATGPLCKMDHIRA